ncbi:thiol-disulfide oxidoreductase DCC family protein [Plebeiibacterium sediminum]|uniref:DCC1-like thiol-disulfide oxidoreductase family protein n=1 Tax=Plebeiibacterium sediminum TaxID=2992112 RepID=A0AAE3M3G9_9BACT|nr:DCC1-like thiol-disulfide oxidoreductase family protein [Plebeiobacterium sediminum]MCW3786085.1 DCC1-like thiol-disulfide oxidoreductase family protein [Plebeiobacterium sediminum]
MNTRRPLVLFDGYCSLCSSVVSFILAYEKNSDLIFAPLHSSCSKNILLKYNLSADTMNTVVLIKDDQVFMKSAAVFEIASYLKMPYRIVKFGGFLPVLWSDFVYDTIAKNRFVWFKRNEKCFLGGGENSSRFIDK